MPPGHWVMLPGENEPDPAPVVIGSTPGIRNEIRERLRRAVRCATMNGTCLDFDPDALVIEALNGICGYAPGERLTRVR